MLAIAPAVLSWALMSPGTGLLGASSMRRSGHPIASTPAGTGLQLPLSALSTGLTAAIEFAVEQGMKDLEVSDEAIDLRALESDEEALEGHKLRLLGELGDIEAAGLVFQADGAPSPDTQGVALVLTAQRAAELDFHSLAELLAASESGSQPVHANRASIALGTVVSETLAEMEAAETNGAQAQSREEARSMHTRWAILELARARYAEDRPADWGSVGEALRKQR